MRVVLDTNVLISGIFFSGPPAKILQAWHNGQIQFVTSTEILNEYQQVGERLVQRYKGIKFEPILGLFVQHAELVQAPKLQQLVSSDPDDDKFLACAVASNTSLIISGDRDLLTVSGYRGIQVLTPRQFLAEYLNESS